MTFVFCQWHLDLESPFLILSLHFCAWLLPLCFCCQFGPRSIKQGVTQEMWCWHPVFWYPSLLGWQSVQTSELLCIIRLLLQWEEISLHGEDKKNWQEWDNSTQFQWWFFLLCGTNKVVITEQGKCFRITWYIGKLKEIFFSCLDQRFGHLYQFDSFKTAQKTC